MELETSRIVVRASPSTHDHEVCLLGDGENLIARFEADLMGLDPDDVLIAPSPLQASDSPHTATIGRCTCGILGCGSVEVLISRRGGSVSWSSPYSTVSVHFDAAQCAGELERAMVDLSWETPDRTAARLIARAADRQHLAPLGLKFQWASGRIKPQRMTVCLDLRSAHQLLVHAPWAPGRSPEAVARDCLEMLQEPPRDWPRVEWLPQQRGLGALDLAGPGWRRSPH